MNKKKDIYKNINTNKNHICSSVIKSERWIGGTSVSYFDTGLTDGTLDTGVTLATYFSFRTWIAVVSFSSLQTTS